MSSVVWKKEEKTFSPLFDRSRTFVVSSSMVCEVALQHQTTANFVHYDLQTNSATFFFFFKPFAIFKAFRTPAAKKQLHRQIWECLEKYGFHKILGMWCNKQLFGSVWQSQAWVHIVEDSEKWKGFSNCLTADVSKCIYESSVFLLLIKHACIQFIWSLMLISCGVCFCADNAGVALVNFYADW